MLDQLVESKNNQSGNRKLSGLLLTTSVVVFSALTVALIFSLFSHSLAMGNENLDITALISPISPPDEAPPEPPKQTQSAEKTISQLPSRQVDMLRIEESPKIIPKTVSVTQNQQKSRPASEFKINGIDSPAMSSGSDTIRRGNNNQTGGTSFADREDKPSSVEIKDKIPSPPPIIKPIPKPEPKIERIVSSGVINGKASYLAQPTYPAAARAVRASGQVKVQVTIDEDGKVISANVVSGHPLLQSAALSAAKSSKFTPTFLSLQKVKVSGFIVYNFVDR